MRKLKHRAKRNAKRQRASLGRQGLAWRSLQRRFPFVWPRRDGSGPSLHRFLEISRADLRDILIDAQWPTAWVDRNAWIDS